MPLDYQSDKVNGEFKTVICVDTSICKVGLVGVDVTASRVKEVNIWSKFVGILSRFFFLVLEHIIHIQVPELHERGLSSTSIRTMHW